MSLQLASIIFISDFDRETLGSESVVSFDTAEQSLVSQSEVPVITSVTSVLPVSDDNPESLALAVNNMHLSKQPTNNNNNQLRLDLPPA